MKIFSIKLNNKCNNNCKYCSNKKGRKTKNEIKNLINGISSGKIILEGKDPLINEDFFEFLEDIAKKGLPFEIKTNARMASYFNFAKKLSSFKPDKIIVKFSSFKPKVFEDITRTNNSYDQTLKGIKNLLFLKVPVEVRFIICKENYNHLNKTLAFLARIGVKDFSFEKPRDFQKDVIKKARAFLKKMKVNEQGEIQTYVQVNTSCNQKCIFCNRPPTREYGKSGTTEIKDIKKRIDELSEDWKIKRIIFTGGEPLLHPKLSDVISYAKKYGFKVEVQTNGTLLNKEKIKELKEARLDIINFAFHSHKKEISDKLRGVDFGFEKIIENIKFANEWGFEIHIIHVINSLNYKDTPEFIDFVEKMNLNNIYLNLSIVVPEGWAWKNKWIIPRMGDVKPYLQDAMKKCKDFGIRFDVSEIVPLCIMQGFEDHAISTLFKKSKIRISDDYYSGQRFLDFANPSNEVASKAPQCKECTFNEICAGFYPRLKELYGVNDFKPRADDPMPVYAKIGFEGKEVELFTHKKQRFPEILYLSLDERCNQNCVFCVVKGENKGKFGSMSKEEAKKIIRNFLESKGKSIVFTGGEPTLVDDLPEIIKYTENFKEINSISIITNGVRLSDKNYLDKILAADKKDKVSFCFSLHSHKKEISELLTDSKNTFKKTISGIKNVYNANKNISIYQVITSKNYKDLLSFCKFLKRNFPKSKTITFAYPFPQGNALKNKWIFTKISSMRPYLLKALNFLEKNDYKISIAACGQFPLCAIPGFEEIVLKSLNFSEENISGVVGEKSFHEFEMDSDEWKEQYKTKNKICQKCILNNICQGFWKEYIELFGFDGIRKITESNFRGNKIVSSLNKKEDIDKVVSMLNPEKLNLLKLSKYNKENLESLIKITKAQKILLIVRFKGKNLYL